MKVPVMVAFILVLGFLVSGVGVLLGPVRFLVLRLLARDGVVSIGTVRRLVVSVIPHLSGLVVASPEEVEEVFELVAAELLMRCPNVSVLGGTRISVGEQCRRLVLGIVRDIESRTSALPSVLRIYYDAVARTIPV